MRSILTSYTFPLSSVKPLSGVITYRAFCLSKTREAQGGAPRRPERSPVGAAPLERAGDVDGLEYLRCPDSGSLFLAALPAPARWARLLAEVSQYRRSPLAFHSGLRKSRDEAVYAPKLEWIESTLRVLGVTRPRVMELAIPPSDFTRFLQASRCFGSVVVTDEADLPAGRADGTVDVAILPECLDRAHDPVAFLRAVAGRLTDGGLLFITALVSSGFDMTVLGLRNLYLFPPDRANCFSLKGLETLLSLEGLKLVEVSTPGVLDVEIVRAHLRHDPALVPLSPFERQLLAGDGDAHAAFQSFLQQRGMSSFARIVARKQSGAASGDSGWNGS